MRSRAREVGPEVHPRSRGMGLRGGPSHLTMTAVSLGISLGGDLLTSWLISLLEKSAAESPPLTVEAAQLWMSRDFGGRTELELIAAGLPNEVEALREAPSRRVGPLLAFWASWTATRTGSWSVFRRGYPPVERGSAAAARCSRQRGRCPRYPSNGSPIRHRQPRDLHRYMSIPLVYGATVTYGRRSAEQVEQARSNLSWYSASIRRRVIAPLHALAPMIREAINSNDQVLLQLERARAASAPMTNMLPPEQ